MVPKLLKCTVHLNNFSLSLYCILTQLFFLPLSNYFFFIWMQKIYLIINLIYQSQGLSSATLEQPTRVHHLNQDQQPTSPSQACRMRVQEQANLVVYQGGYAWWFLLSLQCFFTTCTQTWSLQTKTLLKRLMHKSLILYSIHIKIYQMTIFPLRWSIQVFIILLIVFYSIFLLDSLGSWTYCSFTLTLLCVVHFWVIFHSCISKIQKLVVH